MRTNLYMLIVAAFVGGASYGFAETTTGTMPAQSGEDVTSAAPGAMDMPRIKPVPEPTVYVEDPAYRRMVVITTTMPPVDTDPSIPVVADRKAVHVTDTAD